MLTYADAATVQKGDVVHQRVSWPLVCLDCTPLSVTKATTKGQTFTICAESAPRPMRSFWRQRNPATGRMRWMWGNRVETMRVVITPASATHFHLPSATCTLEGS